MLFELDFVKYSLFGGSERRVYQQWVIRVSQRCLYNKQKKTRKWSPRVVTIELWWCLGVKLSISEAERKHKQELAPIISDLILIGMQFLYGEIVCRDAFPAVVTRKHLIWRKSSFRHVPKSLKVRLDEFQINVRKTFLFDITNFTGRRYRQ